MPAAEPALPMEPMEELELARELLPAPVPMRASRALESAHLPAIDSLPAEVADADQTARHEDADHHEP